MTRKLRKPAQLRPAIAPAQVKPAGMRVSSDAVMTMRARAATRVTKQELFTPYEPPRGVLPSGTTGRKLAMDAGFDVNAAANSWEYGGDDIFSQGYMWPGFTILSAWAQVPEFRRPAEVYAREMTRKWIKIKAAGDVDKSEKIKAIEAEFKRLNVQAVFREAIQQDGLYGRSQIHIEMGLESSQIDPDELKTELIESQAPHGHRADLVIPEPVQRQRSVGSDVLQADVVVCDGQGGPLLAPADHRHAQGAGHLQAGVCVRRPVAVADGQAVRRQLAAHAAERVRHHPCIHGVGAEDGYVADPGCRRRGELLQPSVDLQSGPR
jgi:hypothetical protein